MNLSNILTQLGFKDTNPNHYRPDRILGQGDEVLIVTAILLTAFGSVMVYSATYFVSDVQVFLKHLVLVVIGLGAMLAGMFLDPMILRRWIKLALLGTIIMMILQLFTPLGPEINHTRRWFDLGIINLQTSEIARILLIVFFARVLSDNPDIGRKLSKELMLFLAVPATVFLLTLMQPDLSSMGMMLLVVCLMLFLGGMRVRYFIAAAAVGIPSLFLVLKDYQKARLFGDWSYQQLQSFIAIVRGGLVGGGLALGSAPRRYLPEAHNDFIYAVVGEEWGWFGTAGILIAVILLYIRGIRICLDQPDRFGLLLSAGLICSLTLYALVNMGVNVGLLPVTGLPLPFISKGGTSLVVSLWSVGVLWRLSRRGKRAR